MIRATGERRTTNGLDENTIARRKRENQMVT